MALKMETVLHETGPKPRPRKKKQRAWERSRGVSPRISAKRKLGKSLRAKGKAQYTDSATKRKDAMYT